MFYSYYVVIAPIPSWKLSRREDGLEPGRTAFQIITRGWRGS